MIQARIQQFGCINPTTGMSSIYPSEAPFITIRGDANIVAIKTGAILRQYLSIIFEVSFDELRSLLTNKPTAAILRKFCNDKLLEHVTSANTEAIEQDDEYRRSIGDTQWEAQLYRADDQVICQLSRRDVERYHRDLAEIHMRYGNVAEFENEQFEKVLYALTEYHERVS